MERLLLFLEDASISPQLWDWDDEDIMVCVSQCRGVVKLFNAVAKAQQSQRDAEVLGKQKVGK